MKLVERRNSSDIQPRPIGPLQHPEPMDSWEDDVRPRRKLVGMVLRTLNSNITDSRILRMLFTPFRLMRNAAKDYIKDFDDRPHGSSID